MNGCEVGAEAHPKRSYRNRPNPVVSTADGASTKRPFAKLGSQWNIAPRPERMHR